MGVKGKRLRVQLMLNNGDIVDLGYHKYHSIYMYLYYDVDNIEVAYDHKKRKYTFKANRKIWSKYNLKYLNYSKYKIKKILTEIKCCKIKRKL